MVLVRDEKSGGFVEADKPLGRICSNCGTGCRKGMPYLDEAQLFEHVENNPGAKALALSIVRIHDNNNGATIETDNQVSRAERAEAVVRVCWDGHLREEFVALHKGVTPEDLGIHPAPVTCKATAEAFPGVFFLTCSPTIPVVRGAGVLVCR